jgi:hypothetical protein
MPLDPGSVTVTSGATVFPPGQDPPKISLCTVLEYLTIDGEKPRLQQIAGPKPAVFSDWCAGQSSENSSCSLHVYAESDGVESPHHAETSFELAMAMFGAKVQLKAAVASGGTIADKPDDLSEDEVRYTLADRINSLRGVIIGAGSTSRLPAFSASLGSQIQDEYTCGQLGMIPPL